MDKYLLVVYDSKKCDYYNRVVSSSSKERTAVEFMLLKKEKEVLLNVINYG